MRAKGRTPVMDENKAKLKKELMRYGKEEIVGALLDQFNYGFIAQGCLRTLREGKFHALLDAEQKAFDRADEAFDEYCEWMDRLKEKYGDECEGGRLSLSKLSDDDFNKTKQVCEKMEKAQKQRDAAMKRVEREMRL